MNERLVADNPQTGYAQGRRETFMPDGPAASSEKHARLDQTRDRGKVREAHHETNKGAPKPNGETNRINQEPGSINGNRLELGHHGKVDEHDPFANVKALLEVEIPHDDAVRMGKSARAAQDENPVELSTEDIDFLRDRINKYGNLDLEEVSKMSTAELVVASQRILKTAIILNPEAKSTSKSNVKEKKRRLDVEIELRDIQEVIEGEELGEKKVRDLIKLVDSEPKVTGVDSEQDVLRRVVSTHKPISELSREEAENQLRESGIELGLPEDWDNLKNGSREDFISEARIINEVEPEIEEVEIAGNKYLVWKKDKSTSQVYGFGENLTKEETQAVLSHLGVKEKVPRDWSKHSIEERELWLGERGVEPILEAERFEDYRLFSDANIVTVTRVQIEKIFGIKPPNNWATLDYRARLRVLIANKIMPKMAGAGVDHPEWSDRVDPTQPIGPANPEINNPAANSFIDLSTVINRRMQLINEGLAIAGPGRDWTELDGRITEEVDRLTHASFKGYGEIRVQYETILRVQRGIAAIADPATRAALLADFDMAIPPAFRAQLQTKIDDLNVPLRGIMAGMSAEELREFFDDIKDKSNDLLNSVESGWYSEEYLRKELLEKARENPLNNFRGREGIREWYVMEYELPNVTDILNEFRELKSVTDPLELEKVVRRGLLKAESTSLSAQDLNSYYQRILGLLQNYPRFKDLGFNETATRLYGEISASLLQNQLYLASQSEEGSPEALLTLYKQIQNELAEKGINTKQLYLQRFRMRYTNGEGVEGDDKLPIINPATGEAYDFNLFSDALNVHYWQLAEEKTMMNEIQAAQRENRPLDNNVFTSRGYEVPVGIDKASIENWFKHETFIGASTEVVVNPAGVPNRQGITYYEKQMIKMQARIKKFLRNNRGVSAEQLKNMKFLTRAVNLDAYRWTRVEGGSEYDGLDIYWNQEGVLSDKPQDDLFSERTPFFARAIDNTFKHYRIERRGLPDKTNQVLEETLPYGYMIPTCRVLVRYVDTMFLGNDSPQVYDIASLNARHGLGLAPGTTIKEAVVALKGKISGQFGTSEVHAEGVAIADMVDNGNIRFGRIDNPHRMVDWEEEVRDLTRFNFVDIAGDRGTALKMYDRGALQQYLKRPSFENLLVVFAESFYSGRNVRLWPNMKEAIKAHHKIEQQAKSWFNAKRRGTAYETNSIIEDAVITGRIDPEDEENLKRELLGIGSLPGIGPVRAVRFWAEFVDSQIIRRYIKGLPLSVISAIWEFLAGILQQSAQQVGATR